LRSSRYFLIAGHNFRIARDDFRIAGEDFRAAGERFRRADDEFCVADGNPKSRKSSFRIAINNSNRAGKVR
jgi:hypothetical protein